MAGGFAEKLPEGAEEELEGLVETVTFHSDETGFSVLQLKARGIRGKTTLVATMPQVNEGEWVKARGRWGVDPKHGRQFKAGAAETLLPTSREGLEKFLASGLIHGIGPVYAKKLVARFGLGVMDVIANRSAELETVDGIGPERRKAIRKSWLENQAVREIMTFLMGNGISTARAFRIYKTYGEKALERVRLDPYCLARDIRGIGFPSADKVAQKMGIPADSPLRAKAGLAYALETLSESEGHCAYPREALLDKARDLLGIGREVLSAALAEEVEEGTVALDTVDGEEWAYLSRLLLAERETANRLKALVRRRNPLAATDAAAAAAGVEGKLGLSRAEGQKAAFAKGFSENLLVMTGGPGVGKTTLVRAWVKAFAAKKLRLLLAAPTGRAAKRMEELSGCPAKTIHRLLGYEPATGGFRHNARNPLEADAVIVDETSMLDIELARSLLRAIPATASVILVGDEDQLPSVGPGAFLRDVIASGAVPVARLEHVFRQGEGSLIVENAHRIDRGEMPVIPPRTEPGKKPPDFHFFEAETPEAAVALIRRLAQEALPKKFGFHGEDIQVLTPMQKGELGARNLNMVLQKALNPYGKGAVRFGWEWREGDRVMQTENDYDKDVFNGDLGIIERIDENDGEMVVRYDARRVSYDLRELDRLSPAYAITVHKSQGSEYPCAIIPLHTQHYVMLQRNLLYTAVTRGKKQVVVVGSRRALGLAVRNATSAARYTALARRLQA